MALDAIVAIDAAIVAAGIQIKIVVLIWHNGRNYDFGRAPEVRGPLCVGPEECPRWQGKPSEARIWGGDPARLASLV